MSTSPVEVVTSILAAAAPVTALVSDRITPEWRSQATALPAIVVTNVGANRFRNVNGTARTLTEALVQVDVYGEGYSATGDVADLVRDALDDYSGTIAGVDVDEIGLSLYQDLGENDGDKAIRRVSLDFNVWFQE